jgi:pimeloyl-ACP methyl ester carboxylesterase
MTMPEAYTRQQQLKDGIEWVSYLLAKRNQFPPILMQHGMWHGAWCWQGWQEVLTEQGWESHAISLPGHGGSPVQRPIRLCTLDYYLKFVQAAVDSLPQKPILMGHSMGGALTQWYLRDVGNLPAAVLVAPWALYKGFWDCGTAFRRLDLWGCILSYLIVRSEWVRTPERAAKALLSPNSVVTAQQLYDQLTPESLLVLFQHLRRWSAPESLTTPILWLGAERDRFIPEFAARRAASIYPSAEYVMIVGAAHNLMMEHNFREIALQVDRWLVDRLTA